MKKLYCVLCGKYRKFEKPKISYVLEKTLVFSIICSKGKNEDEKMFKEKESIEMLKILDLVNNIEKYQNIASLVGIPIGTASSAVGLKVCVRTAGMKKYKSIIKKKKWHDKIVLLAKSKLNSTEVLISRALIDSNFSHDEFV